MKLKIYTKRKKKEHRRTQTWRLNNILLNLWANHEIKEEIRKYLETNENGNAAPPNLQNVAKAVLRGKFIATWGAQSTGKISSNLAFQLKVLEKEK